MTTKLFVVLAVAVLGLVGYATYRDQSSREYLAIQQQYIQDHPGSTINIGVQQLFPNNTIAGAEIGTNPKVERCITCHVPDIAQIGPQNAAQNLVTDFYKYEPNAAQMASDYNLSRTHPAVVTSTMYSQYGPNANLTETAVGVTDPATGQNMVVQVPGFIPSSLDPSGSGAPSGGYGIDQTGCIICHNGNRLALTESEAHTNLIVNPEYSWTEGAALYYKNCAICHGPTGEGGSGPTAGPPLNNQDRLGFFNEDYYLRCIEYGYTGFEHYGSAMPNWSGQVASGYNGPSRGAPPVTLTPAQIKILVQFIRHWENYSTLP